MDGGNHVTDWWLKVLVGEVWVTVGETVCEKVSAFQLRKTSSEPRIHCIF